MSQLLIKLFNESVNSFFAIDIKNIEDDVAERNLCARLAIHLTPKLFEYNIKGYFADPEYNRKQGGDVKTILDEEESVIRIQCDLIVHSRGVFKGKDNLIAIEMKKSTRQEAEKISDRKRLRAMTKDSYDGIWSADGGTNPEHVCGYVVGVYMILNIKERICILEYYQHGKQVNERTQVF
jgi:hypothetical protein